MRSTRRFALGATLLALALVAGACGSGGGGTTTSGGTTTGGATTTGASTSVDCTVCHNPRQVKEPEVSGGLTLDTYAAVLKWKAKNRTLVHGGKILPR